MMTIKTASDLVSREHESFRPKIIIFNLMKSNELLTSMGLKPISLAIQWELLAKLCRELAMDVEYQEDDGETAHRDRLIQHELVNVDKYSDEVYITPNQKFFDIYYELRDRFGRESITTPIVDGYRCKLWLNDNKLVFNINDVSYQVGKLTDGAVVSKLFNALFNVPPKRPIIVTDFSPQKKLNIKQVLAKNHYNWLEPMFDVYRTNSIAIGDTKTIAHNELISMAKMINEKYRNPILSMLETSKPTNE